MLVCGGVYVCMCDFFLFRFVAGTYLNACGFVFGLRTGSLLASCGLYNGLM